VAHALADAEGSASTQSVDRAAQPTRLSQYDEHADVWLPPLPVVLVLPPVPVALVLPPVPVVLVLPPVLVVLPVLVVPVLPPAPVVPVALCLGAPLHPANAAATRAMVVEKPSLKKDVMEGKMPGPLAPSSPSCGARGAHSSPGGFFFPSLSRLASHAGSSSFPTVR
jgi:hypothetical protein